MGSESTRCSTADSEKTNLNIGLANTFASTVSLLAVERIKFFQAETDRVSSQGVYWGLTALDLMNRKDELDREEVIAFVLACQHETGTGCLWHIIRLYGAYRQAGGFGGSINHDPHLIYTLSAVQILVTLDALDRLDTDRVVSCR